MDCSPDRYTLGSDIGIFLQGSVGRYKGKNPDLAKSLIDHYKLDINGDTSKDTYVFVHCFRDRLVIAFGIVTPNGNQDANVNCICVHPIEKGYGFGTQIFRTICLQFSDSKLKGSLSNESDNMKEVIKEAGGIIQGDSWILDLRFEQKL